MQATTAWVRLDTAAVSMPRRRQRIGSNACQARGTGFTVAKDIQERNLGLGPLGIRGMSEEISRSRGLAAALGLCLAVAVIPALGADHTFDGVYTGKRSAINGTVAPNCPAEEDVSVTIYGETLSFNNSALRKFVIGSNLSQDGSFQEIYAGEGGATVNIVGRITGDVLDADVTNPPCEQHWHLKKG